jgi:hypothetical protein
MVRQHLCTAAKMEDKRQAKMLAQAQRGGAALGEVRMDQVGARFSKVRME